MQKYRKFLVVLWLVKTGHSGNVIGGKILFRFCRKSEKNYCEIWSDKRIFFGGKE